LNDECSELFVGFCNAAIAGGKMTDGSMRVGLSMRQECPLFPPIATEMVMSNFAQSCAYRSRYM
jgi:hypothetical protein